MIANSEFRALCAQWHAADTQLRRAERTAVQRATDYCATPDGISESQRRIDLCEDPDELVRLLAAHQLGQKAAAAEFRARLANNPVPERRDGYLFALPLGDRTAAAQVLVDTHIVGSCRIRRDREGPVPVLLRRVRADGTRGTSRRLWFPWSGRHPITLTKVVGYLFAGDAMSTLAELLDGDYPRLIAALVSEPPTGSDRVQSD